MKELYFTTEFKYILQNIKGWSLFLDRDGVINKRIQGNYVKTLEEFEFLPGVLDAICQFNKIFKYIFIVTNQQGIGKSLMTNDDLLLIHNHLKDMVKEKGGNINKIYYCPGLAKENPLCRKPNIGMALQAKADFPEVDLSKSIMIGDTESDMLFANNAGMKGIYLSEESLVLPSGIKYEGVIPSLISFANYLNENLPININTD